MPFTQGESGNPSGRPPGSQNKTKKQLREMIEQFLLDNFEKVQQKFNDMEVKDQVKFYCSLLPYGLEKTKSESDMLFERLTEQELDELFQKLKDVATRTIKETAAQARIPERAAEG